MTLAVEIAIGSSAQIALLVAPVLVLASFAMGTPMTLLFHPFEIVAVGLSVVATTIVALDGESNWVEGLQLLAIYLVVAAAFYLIPATAITEGDRWNDDRAILLWAVFAVVLVFLARGLPQRTFVVGDPGLKLIAARNAMEHPARPFDIDLPRIGGRPVDLVDPSFRIHGDHTHAATSELFPLMTAPFIAAFGISGAYVLPALGFLLALAATAWAGVALDGAGRRPRSSSTTAACTPLLFYGLEFWEHAPAVGVAALATAMFVRRRSVLGLLDVRVPARGCGSASSGGGVVLRRALGRRVVASVPAHRAPPGGGVRRHGDRVGAGGAASFVHSGQLLGGHVTETCRGSPRTGGGTGFGRSAPGWCRPQRRVDGRLPAVARGGDGDQDAAGRAGGWSRLRARRSSPWRRSPPPAERSGRPACGTPRRRAPGDRDAGFGARKGGRVPGRRRG